MERYLQETYGLSLVLLCILLVAAACCAAIGVAEVLAFSRNRLRFAWLASGVLSIGLAIEFVRYVGMATLRFGEVGHSEVLLALSGVLAAGLLAPMITPGWRVVSRSIRRRFFARLAVAIMAGFVLVSAFYAGLAANGFSFVPGRAGTSTGVSLREMADIGFIVLVALAATLVSIFANRYMAEEQLLKESMLRAVEEANRLRAATLDSTSLSIITANINGTILSLNREAESLLGYQAVDLVGKAALTALHDWQELSKEARSLSRELSTPVDVGLEAITALAQRGLRDEREWSYFHKDGSRIPVRLSVTQLNDSEGETLGFLAVAQDMTGQIQTEASVHHLALHDPLTDLPNRALLQEQVARSLVWAERHQAQVAMALLDLDRFKHINDTLGHQVGDQVLIVIAQRLSATVRASDTVVRLGGDEFVVLMPGIEHPNRSAEAMQRVLKAIGEPIVIGAFELYTTPSIGISAYPADGADLDTLLRKADRAMYRAKERGRNTIEIYNHEMERDAARQLEMEGSMRRALKRNEFSLMFQPIFSLSTGSVTGVETLLRWKHADQEFISPPDFVPLAEETGLILPIGEWVLRTACAQAAEFSRAAGFPLRMSINISPRQFKAPSLFGVIAELLAAHQMQPEHLELEITEGVLLDERDGVAETVGGLRAIGVRVAMDDFGTGFSSLGYLRRFPIDRLKIDRSFIGDIGRDVDKAALASAIIALGHHLKLPVTAEGVETMEQVEYLRERGCDEAQGFYLARPMFAEQLMEFLSTESQLSGGPFAPLVSSERGSSHSAAD